MEVEYCPTEEILEDVLNKPNQGNNFIDLRYELMNVVIYYDDDIKISNRSDCIAGMKLKGEKISEYGTKKLT